MYLRIKADYNHDHKGFNVQADISHVCRGRRFSTGLAISSKTNKVGFGLRGELITHLRDGTV